MKFLAYGKESEQMPDGENPTMFSCSTRHFLTFGNCIGQRLFGDHMEFVLESGPCQRRANVRGSGDQSCIDAIGNFADGSRRLRDAVFHGQAPRSFHIAIDQRGQLYVGDREGRRNVRIHSDCPAPHDSQANRRPNVGSSRIGQHMPQVQVTRKVPGGPVVPARVVRVGSTSPCP